MSEINLKSNYVSNKMLYKNNSHLHKTLWQNRSFLKSFGFNFFFFFHLQRDFSIVHYHVLVFFLFLWIVLISFTSLYCSLSLFSWYSPVNVKSSCEKSSFSAPNFNFLESPCHSPLGKHFLLMSEINLKSKYVSNKKLYKNN